MLLGEFTQSDSYDGIEPVYPKEGFIYSRTVFNAVLNNPNALKETDTNHILHPLRPYNEFESIFFVANYALRAVGQQLENIGPDDNIELVGFLYRTGIKDSFEDFIYQYSQNSDNLDQNELLQRTYKYNHLSKGLKLVEGSDETRNGTRNVWVKAYFTPEEKKVSTHIGWETDYPETKVLPLLAIELLKGKIVDENNLPITNLDSLLDYCERNDYRIPVPELKETFINMVAQKNIELFIKTGILNPDTIDEWFSNCAAWQLMCGCKIYQNSKMNNIGATFPFIRSVELVSPDFLPFAAAALCEYINVVPEYIGEGKAFNPNLVTDAIKLFYSFAIDNLKKCIEIGIISREEAIEIRDNIAGYEDEYRTSLIRWKSNPGLWNKRRSTHDPSGDQTKQELSIAIHNYVKRLGRRRSLHNSDQWPKYMDIKRRY